MFSMLAEERESMVFMPFITLIFSDRYIVMTYSNFKVMTKSASDMKSYYF